MVKKIKSECGWIVFHLNNNELNKLMDKDYFGNICDSGIYQMYIISRS